MKIEGLNFDDLSNYRDLMDDIIDRVIAIQTIFKKYFNSFSWQHNGNKNSDSYKVMDN